MEFPELRKADEPTRRAKFAEVAKQYVDKKMPPVKYDYGLVDVDTSGGSRSGSEDDKREEPVEGGESTESLMLTNPDGTRTRQDVKYPWSYDVPTAPETSVPLDSRVIDYETNTFLKGDNLGKIATFKPKKIYPQLIKGTNKTELYVIGTAQVEEEDFRGAKVVKEFNYKVPYDKVKPAIATKYKLNKVDEKFKNTNLTPAKKQSATSAKKEIKASDISSRAKAAGYTDQEYRKLLTEKGVKIIE